MAFSDRLQMKDWTYAAGSRAAQRRSELALYILIGSLAVFFGSALLLYFFARYGLDVPAPRVALPNVFWLSTGLALSGGAALWGALRAVRRERQSAFRWRLVLAFLLGTAFCLSQSVGLAAILQGHSAVPQTRSPLNGVLFVIILLHALHFIVGLGALAVVTWRGLRGRYDHEFHAGVRLCAVYWRFMDVVWIVLYAVFLVTVG